MTTYATAHTLIGPASLLAHAHPAKYKWQCRCSVEGEVPAFIGLFMANGNATENDTNMGRRYRLDRRALVTFNREVLDTLWAGTE